MREQNLASSGLIDPFLRKISFELDPKLQCVEPKLVQALEIWNAARGDRVMPARRDLDPGRMPPALLPHMLLIDVEYEPRMRFRWRLIGTYITEVMGRDSTGRYWDELYDPIVVQALSTGPLWAMEHRRPIRTRGIGPREGKGHLRSENLDMPLSEDGEIINMLVVISVYS